MLERIARCRLDCNYAMLASVYEMYLQKLRDMISDIIPSNYAPITKLN